MRRRSAAGAPRGLLLTSAAPCTRTAVTRGVHSRYATPRRAGAGGARGVPRGPVRGARLLPRVHGERRSPVVESGPGGGSKKSISSLPALTHLSARAIQVRDAALGLIRDVKLPRLLPPNLAKQFTVILTKETKTAGGGGGTIAGNKRADICIVVKRKGDPDDDQAFPAATRATGNSRSAAEAGHSSSPRPYKCRKCGQPKKGHVCLVRKKTARKRARHSDSDSSESESDEE